jgi:ABC-2 type transport system ATP-binding protein
MQQTSLPQMARTMTPVLKVQDLKKKFGNITAVDEISFDVNPREIVGLLGPNGAGKTTTINMILSVLEPSAGTITIDGSDSASDRTRVLMHTNFAAVYAPLLGNLTILQNLRVFGMLYGIKRLTERIEEVIRQFDLEPFRKTKYGVLSSGEQTKVNLAKAMLNKPQLLLLDEPTASLDPSISKDIRAGIREFVKSGTTGVLWTSHNMYEVEEVCDRVLFLSRGKILLEGNPRTLPEEYGKKSLEDLFITVAREPLSLDLV